MITGPYEDRSDQLPDTQMLEARPLTREEELVFIFVLDRLRTWAAQLNASALMLSNRPEDAVSLTPRELATAKYAMVNDLAHAMQLGFAR
ncbi:hypothetical protein [uncultured Salipiger sp.]|uniref:hypothetical protein n=1 Tax=uncultured Salipiger sp. TaxID=499810 RepID=UPI0025956CB6|nr:hypothetical protein [uncultured Salipiger sp.]